MVHQIRPAGRIRGLSNTNPIRWKRGAAVLLLLGLVPLLAWWWQEQKPDSLRESYLLGTRGPGCIRVIIASDMSGSMYEFTQPREQALAQLLEWVPRNLRDDDELAVLAFSGDTFIDMPPTAVGRRPVLKGVPDPTDGTQLSSLVAVLSSLPETRCTTSLMLLSDGVFGDMPADAHSARLMLRDAGVSSLFLLVPGEDIPVNPDWYPIFPFAEPSVFNGMSPDATGLVLGRTLATITGQRLEKS